MSLFIRNINLPENTDGLSINFHNVDGSIETHILDVTDVTEIKTPHGYLYEGKDVLNLVERGITCIPIIEEER